MTREVFAPGRVTILGDHTDYAGGSSLAIALDLGTTARFEASDAGVLSVTSEQLPNPVVLQAHDLSVPQHDSFARMIAGLVLEMTQSGPFPSGELHLRSSLPLGAGLSSSASLLVACALALGVDLPPLEFAMLVQRCESHAGQEVGLLDPLSIVLGQASTGVHFNFADLSWSLAPINHAGIFTVVHSGVTRSLATSDYAIRRSQCQDAAQLIGPLGSATLSDVATIDNTILRRRARHVVTETQRVSACADALEGGDLTLAGALMNESHASLRDDFDVSCREVNQLVDSLNSQQGVYGVRMTGAGFGGCVVVLSDEVDLDLAPGTASWRVRPSSGARVTSNKVFGEPR